MTKAQQETQQAGGAEEAASMGVQLGQAHALGQAIADRLEDLEAEADRDGFDPTDSPAMDHLRTLTGLLAKA